MKSRGVVGKRISSIIQKLIADEGRSKMFHVDAIVLEDGTTLRPWVREGEGEYYIGISVCHPEKKS
jgi:hypothetical protein